MEFGADMNFECSIFGAGHAVNQNLRKALTTKETKVNEVKQ